MKFTGRYYSSEYNEETKARALQSFQNDISSRLNIKLPFYVMELKAVITEGNRTLGGQVSINLEVELFWSELNIHENTTENRKARDKLNQM